MPGFLSWLSPISTYLFTVSPIMHSLLPFLALHMLFLLLGLTFPTPPPTVTCSLSPSLQPAALVDLQELVQGPLLPGCLPLLLQSGEITLFCSPIISLLSLCFCSPTISCTQARCTSLFSPPDSELFAYSNCVFSCLNPGIWWEHCL